MVPCRIGVTGDLLREDGRLAFPGYFLDGLAHDPRVEVVRLPVDGGIDPAPLAGIDILISVPMGAAITRASLARADRLAAILRVGVGYDDVDVGACTAVGVALVVPSAATKRPTAVAALTLILALATRLVEKHVLTLAGPETWGRRADLRGLDLEGLTLGLIGCGHIGKELVAIARPLGFRMLVADPALSHADGASLGVSVVPLETLLREADFVSIHCPLNEANRHLLDARHLALMKRTAYLVNTARGGIVDQSALVEALREERIAGAGLDVFEPEPLPAGHPLLSLNNVLFSAHALNWTVGLDAALARSNVDDAFTLLQGRAPAGVVNRAVLDAGPFRRKLRRIGEAFARAATPERSEHHHLMNAEGSSR